MQKTLSAILYEYDNPNASRSVSVKIKDGFVSFYKQDYNTSDAFDKFSEFICSNHLKYDVYCG